MTTYSSLESGIISPDELPYLARRAEGGFGAIVTAACYISPAGKAFNGQWGCDNDDKLESLRSVAQTIQDAGSKVILQIHHGGRSCPPELSGGECLSASAVPASREGAPVPREMTDAEIEQTLDDYAKAAFRAKQAGYDAVEIHGANTYLVQQFVSPHSNRRTDKWNSDDLMFPIELTRRVIEAVGEDFPVGYRFSPEESDTPGIRLDRTKSLIDALCEFPLSFLHVSLREYDQLSFQGEEAISIMKLLSDHINGRIKLVGVGSVFEAADVQKALNEGADALALARGALYDPDWVNHYANNKPIATSFRRSDFPDKYVLPHGMVKMIQNASNRFNFEEEA
jgi:2,4-dienoyl-CoA reductase-like NADH-dependent reductase (Old Yellow Enzyme family)